MTITCPKCNQNLKVRDELQDKKGRCPNCGEVFDIPYPLEFDYEDIGFILVECDECRNIMNVPYEKIGGNWRCDSCKYIMYIQDLTEEREKIEDTLMEVFGPNDKIILIADDEPDICDTMKFLLEMEENVHVFTEHNGIAAVKLAERIHPHLIVTDYRKPGMNGYYLAQCIHDIFPDNTPKIIVFSGFITTEMKKSFEGLVDAYFSKPGGQELFDTIKKFLSEAD